MGVDCGFDMVPPLTGLDSDTIRWRAFIEKIKEIFQNDPVVQLQPRFIEFQVGEHPLLPFEGHKFLRFSSKTSGFRSAAAEPYIDDVYRLARTFFGEQVRFWHELNEGNGFYDWKAVNESFKSYYDSVCSPISYKSPRKYRFFLLYHSLQFQVQLQAPQMTVQTPLRIKFWQNPLRLPSPTSRYPFRTKVKDLLRRKTSQKAAGSYPRSLFSPSPNQGLMTRP